MDTKTFWSIIEAAKVESQGDCERQAEILSERLAALKEEEIIKFDKILEEHRALAYTWDLWAAAYITNGGCSDDCFDYFGGWLIAQGQSVFENALRDPEYLVNVEVPTGDDEPVAECESILYVAMTAYEAKTGSELPAEMMPWRPEFPAGEGWDEDNVAEKYPKLAEKFDW
jgi:hypothetical protein